MVQEAKLNNTKTLVRGAVEVITERIEIEFDLNPYGHGSLSPLAIVGSDEERIIRVRIAKVIRGKVDSDDNGQLIDSMTGRVILDLAGNTFPGASGDSAQLEGQLHQARESKQKLKLEYERRINDLKKKILKLERKSREIDFIFHAGSEGSAERAFMEALLDEDPCVAAAIEKYQGKSDG